jgi:hypothetical protein
MIELTGQQIHEFDQCYAEANAWVDDQVWVYRDARRQGLSEAVAVNLLAKLLDEEVPTEYVVVSLATAIARLARIEPDG